MKPSASFPPSKTTSHSLPRSASQGKVSATWVSRTRLAIVVLVIGLVLLPTKPPAIEEEEDELLRRDLTTPPSHHRSRPGKANLVIEAGDTSGEDPERGSQPLKQRPHVVDIRRSRGEEVLAGASDVVAAAETDVATDFLQKAVVLQRFDEEPAEPVPKKPARRPRERKAPAPTWSSAAPPSVNATPWPMEDATSGIPSIAKHGPRAGQPPGEPGASHVVQVSHPQQTVVANPHVKVSVKTTDEEWDEEEEDEDDNKVEEKKLHSRVVAGYQQCKPKKEAHPSLDGLRLSWPKTLSSADIFVHQVPSPSAEHCLWQAGACTQ
ncbi:hypothetical protein CYMTET_21589 [Cymbomonas tetramitiformis]|uniref:Uncharacterized protein n=1 Tax=Cymbomonas tetramitiformis TaxID=36881 RepID=A0AAE0L348_9CHLO|nr:hypothetical protein CYMTET_21589 [Cymbomonas tetramitiformis]